MKLGFSVLICAAFLVFSLHADAKEAMTTEKVFLQRGASDWLYTVDYSYPTNLPPPDADGKNWYEKGYDTSAWSKGTAPLGFGDENQAEYGTVLPNNHGAYYFVRYFEIKDVSLLKSFCLTIVSDNSIKVFINGRLVEKDDQEVEETVKKATVFGKPTFDKPTGYFKHWNRRFNVDSSVLVNGKNIIAIKLLLRHPQSRIYHCSPDAHLDVELYNNTDIVAQDGSGDFNGTTNNRVIVAQDGSGDFNGTTEEPIIKAIREVRGGGTVFIKKGVYKIRKVILLYYDTNLTLSGEPGTVLQLEKAETIVSEEAPVGQEYIVVEKDNTLCGSPVKFKTEKGTGSFRGWAEPPNKYRFNKYYSSPLGRSIPRGTKVVSLHNLFDIHGGKKITIRDMVLDGSIHEGADFGGHISQCVILAHGAFSYKNGPGEPIEDFHIINCTIKNARGRLIALYVHKRCKIMNCKLLNSLDAGIDIDHFCYHCEVTDNEIHNCDLGIEINDASYCLIARNTIKDCADGIRIWWWHMMKQKNLNAENKIRNNLIRVKGIGVDLAHGSARNEITDNTINGGTIGVMIEGRDNILKNNTICNMKQYGIEITGRGNTIAENRCIGNCLANADKFDGIYVSGSYNKIINNVSGKGKGKVTQRYGIHVMGIENRVIGNKCVGNNFGPMRIVEGNYQGEDK